MKVLLSLTLLILIIVIPLGAFTRLSDAGLGCPDWPGCYGYLDFRDSMEHVNKINAETNNSLRAAEKTWPEMVHRYFASSLGLLILIMALVNFGKRKTEEYWGSLPYFLFVLVCFQGLLGMWTVTMKLYPPTVVGHLYGGFITFTLCALLALKVFKVEFAKPEKALAKVFPLAVVSLVILLVQIGLGGWMSSNYAALVCSELPICESGWVNKLAFAEAFSAPYDPSVDYEFGILSHDARTTIHVLHRVFALIASVLIILLSVRTLGLSSYSHVKNAAYLVLVLLAIQVLLGISNVVFVLPISVATAHNGFGALLMLSVSYLVLLSYKAKTA